LVRGGLRCPDPLNME